ncbi:MAG TPA: peptidylprolyl isomerase, partial [Victivallales bacterium]|nr:peptidylprolyl isomerase [Victivallales bacterium]
MLKIKTSLGDIIIQLDEKNAPITCQNFMKYVEMGHYNGTIFHRVIDGFMIQGGGFDTSFRQLPTMKPIINEANNVYENAISNLKSDTAAELDKSKAILIKTISAVLYDKINYNSNLLNEFVNDIKIDSLSLS